MSSGQLLCLLLTLPFGFSTNASDASAAGDLTVSSGDSVFLSFPLTFNFPDFRQISVKWEKDGRTLCHYYIDSNAAVAPECNPRFKVNTRPLGLNVSDVKSSDAGLYQCSMTKIIPPPAEEITEHLTLKVLSLTLQLVSSTNSSCVELLCSLQGSEPQQVTFTWTMASQLLHRETSNMSSILTLCNPDRKLLVCHARHSNNGTLSKSVALPCNSVGCKKGGSSWLVIALTSTCAGLFLLILLSVAIFKCKQRYAVSGAVFYQNKIYENFTFSTATVNPTPVAPRNARPVAGANVRTSTPSTICQREECIYEN